MEDVLVKIFTGSASLATIFLILKYLSECTEKLVKPELKKEWGKVIIELDITSPFKNLSSYVLNLINVIFTNKQFSWKCFWRSLAASGTIVLLLHFIFFFYNPSLLSSRSGGAWLSFFINFIIFSLLFNSLDFFLLWKTRKILNWVAISNSALKNYAIFIDIITSFLFGLLKYIILMLLISPGTINFTYFLKEVLQIKIPDEFYPPKNQGVIPGLFFYATFLYSVFLVLYFYSAKILKYVQMIDKAKKFFQGKFDIENEPIAFLKFVFGLLVLLVAVGIIIVKYLKQ